MVTTLHLQKLMKSLKIYSFLEPDVHCVHMPGEREKKVVRTVRNTID